MAVPRKSPKRNPGRPKELSDPERLSLYAEGNTVADLGRLARDLSQEARRGVSLARALSTLVGESARLKTRPAPRRRRSAGMTLSEAIRSGAKAHPQAMPNVFFEYDPKHRETPIGSSALGAAWVALGLKPQDLLTVDLHERFPQLGKKLGDCPANAACGNWRSLEVQITHLEDQHKWDREHIASWLKKRGL